MKKSIRERFVKQSLNSFMWSRYLAVRVNNDCPFIIKHHNGIDDDDLTTNVFDLNLSLLKALRSALKSATPADFDDFFGLNRHYPRKIHRPTELYRTLKNASDEELVAISPLFGGCLFKVGQQDCILEYLSFQQSEKKIPTQTSPFKAFVQLFWLSVWLHAHRTPILTSILFGLREDLVEVVRVSNAEKIWMLVNSSLNFQFSIEISENLILSAPTHPHEAVMKLLMTSSLLNHRVEPKALGFKE